MVRPVETSRLSGSNRWAPDYFTVADALSIFSREVDPQIYNMAKWSLVSGVVCLASSAFDTGFIQLRRKTSSFRKRM